MLTYQFCVCWKQLLCVYTFMRRLLVGPSEEMQSKCMDLLNWCMWFYIGFQLSALPVALVDDLPSLGSQVGISPTVASSCWTDWLQTSHSLQHQANGAAIFSTALMGWFYTMQVPVPPCHRVYYRQVSLDGSLPSHPIMNLRKVGLTLSDPSPKQVFSLLRQTP